MKYLKDKFTCSNKDELLPIKKEQEFIDFAIYSKLVLIDSNNIKNNIIVKINESNENKLIE